MEKYLLQVWLGYRQIGNLTGRQGVKQTVNIAAVKKRYPAIRPVYIAYSGKSVQSYVSTDGNTPGVCFCKSINTCTCNYLSLANNCGAVTATLYFG